jgi:single-strand DNA-binding protein
MYLNKAMIYGNLTRDPEMKALPSGMQVCSFSVATNRTYNDRDGKRQEAVAKYLTKGSGVYVEGRLQTQSWEKDGVKQYRTEIVLDRFEFGPKSGGSAGPSGASQPSAAGSSAGSGSDSRGGAPVLPEYPSEDINPEDIPF